MVPTPLVYFTVFHRQTAGCVMVTASHNPACDNGFKLMNGRESLHGDEIQYLHQRMSNLPEASRENGQHHVATMIDTYCDDIYSRTHPIVPRKIVVDAGNGPAGIVAIPLLKRLHCEVIPLFCEPDGHFPNHHPDPSKMTNLQALMDKVRETGADLGVAYDGDGDRIGVVDHHGAIVWNDMLLLMLARHLLRQCPGASIVSEVKSSNRMYEAIRKSGGKPVMSRTGHSPVKAKMKETDALLAGEMSGHIFFADRYYGFDDAIYATVRILEMLSETGKTLPELIADIPSAICTPEIRIPCPDSEKFALVKQAMPYFKSLSDSLIDVDGIRVHFPNGWGLLRASNTEACLMLRFEADTVEELARIEGLFILWLKEHVPTFSHALKSYT